MDNTQIPPEQCAIRMIDLDAPLTRWEQTLAFDTAQDCEQSRIASLQIARGQQGNIRATSTRSEMIAAHHFRWAQEKARCISSSDPRLIGTR
jgi:hypothetical protein